MCPINFHEVAVFQSNYTTADTYKLCLHSHRFLTS